MFISSNPLFKEWLKRLTSFGWLLIKHLKSHAITWLLFVALYQIFSINYTLGINLTPSLPYKLFLIGKNEKVESGEFIAFTWHGGKPYRNGAVFVKRLLASPGDSVVKNGRDFIVGTRVITGKREGLKGKILFPNNELIDGRNIIQLGKYFVAGDHEYSLDSRYSALGLVDKKDVVGRAFPIF